MKGRYNRIIELCHSIMVPICILALNSCADEMVDNMTPTTSEHIGFNAAYKQNIGESKTTRTQSSAEEKSYRCESSDGELSIEINQKEGIKASVSQQITTRGTQINGIGEWSYNIRAFYDNPTDNEGPYSYFTYDPNGLEIASNSEAYATDYYWPPYGEMNFIAYAPASLGNAVTVGNDGQTFSYTIPNAVEEQKDLLGTYAVGNCPSIKPINLTFEHMLAAVEFKVGQMQFIKLSSLSINGVKGGTVTMTYDTENSQWNYSASNNNVTYSPIYVKADGNPNFDMSGLPEGAHIAGSDNGLMMLVMPQTIGEGASLTIGYEQLLDGQKKEKTISFSKEHEWIAGQTTSYVVNIGTDIIQIEIPTPPDADAHYVRVDMAYDVSQLSNVTSITAKAYWEEDGSNTASAAKQDIKLKTSLTPMQQKGYFTDEQWKLEYEITSNGTNPANPVPVKVGNIIGEDELNIAVGSKGNIYLFIEENDGTTDRNGVLEFMAKSAITGETFTIGKGRFKQLCPSWNNDGLGAERFEDEETHPWGFNYNRKVSYTSNYTPDDLKGFWGFIYKIILVLFGGITNEVIPDGTVAADGFINTKTVDIFGRDVIWYVELDYSALNKVSEEANSTDGLTNTKALYKYTGNTDISELENQLNKNISNWEKEILIDADIPEVYAAFVALKCNKMREVHVKISSSEGTQELDKVLLHKVAEGNGIANGSTVNEDGEDLIEWYLPSFVEAQDLVETGTGDESTPISMLDGTYWSSNAGNDSEAQAYSFTFSNNNFVNYNSTDGRLEYRKIRAVRKKPE